MPDLACHLHAALCSSMEMLGEYLRGRLCDAQDLQALARSCARRHTGHLPDYRYTNLQAHLYSRADAVPPEDGSGPLHRALEHLADTYLECHCGRVHVKRMRFASWQELIIRVPPLPVVAACLCRDAHARGLSRPWELVPAAVRHSSLPRMGAPALEQLLETHGLAELHLHLNGSSEAGVVWLHALRSPVAVSRELKRALGDRGIVDLLRQAAPFLTSSHQVYKLLRLAGWLRRRLARSLLQPGDDHALSADALLARLDLDRLHTQEEEDDSTTRHPLAPSTSSPRREENQLPWEAAFLVRAIHALPQASSVFASALHCYLLIQACHQRLLVQQDTQNGFDQFQRIADSKLRDPMENESAGPRFHQLLEHMPGERVHVEGRFSPKATTKAAWKSLARTNRQWRRVLRERAIEPSDPRSEPSLALVAHFIKKRDRRPSPFCRHAKLRRELECKAWALATLHDRFPSFGLCGLDAAGNEMHAPPEVFAPVFRFLRWRNWSQFTFHAGEDFVHLASGLRAVYEAVTFLELGYKDRIGHGVALGIEPRLWRERLGGDMTISQGEWLDNLLFLYDLLREHPDPLGHVPMLRARAEDLALRLYDEAVPLPDLIRAWRLRSLDPLVAFGPQAPSILPFTRDEQDRCIREAGQNLRAWELFRRHHQDSILRKRTERMLRLRAEAMSSDEQRDLPPEVLRDVQRRLMDMLRERQMAIEIMPTSNLRIACYKSYEEHHLFRLLIQDETPLLEHPDLVLASDDPGIFATSLRNEYAHVFSTLRAMGLPKHQALEHVRRLLEASWTFRFTAKPAS